LAVGCALRDDAGMMDRRSRRSLDPAEALNLFL